MTTIQERGTALREQAAAMLHTARQLDRLPTRWRLSHEAERDMRGSRDHEGQYLYGIAGLPQTLLGLPIDVDQVAAAITLELENGDRILPGGELGAASVSIEIMPAQRRRYDPRL